MGRGKDAMIVSLDPDKAEDRHDAARLHKSLLGDSPIAHLGNAFMENFYYNKLIRDGLVRCDLYRHEGRTVALSAYTRRPFTFLSEGRRAHFAFLSLVLAGGVVSRPSRLGVIFETLGLERRRGAASEDPQAGELLSFGVEPAFSSYRDEATGKKVPNLLMDRALGYFKNEGFKSVQMIIRKDNLPSLLFFNSYGASVQSADYVGPQCYLLKVAL